ncbi:hypothetical protein KFE80_00285 [bacterium SCSIO 12696]|nr:hypothetical protein KFE80_00285 [bacterium SCSIO 12696]
MIDRNIDNLLGELCIKWGFCLPPKEHHRIASACSWDAESFARDVVESEGLNPEYEVGHVRSIRNKFIEVLGSNVYKSENS